MAELEPTVFHITHWKAGSQWVLAVLSQCAPGRVVQPKVKIAHFLEDVLLPGAIYPTIYVPRPRFQKVLLPSFGTVRKQLLPLVGERVRQMLTPPSESEKELQRSRVASQKEARDWYHFKLRRMPVIKFFVIRDLRDALISHYFSLKVSHPVISKRVADSRQILSELDFEEGFIYLINSQGRTHANIQSTWLPICERGDALLVRYEDLIADEQNMFAKIVEHCRIDVSASSLEEIVEANSFTKQTGRQPGEEDVTSHYRKGISGDWRNYFTDRIKMEFKKQFGQLLIETGYEKDLNW